jgi:hypothetical protein
MRALFHLLAASGRALRDSAAIVKDRRACIRSIDADIVRSHHAIAETKQKLSRWPRAPHRDKIDRK